MADTLDTSLEGSLKNVPGLSEYLAMKQYLARQARDEQQQGQQQQFIQERSALGPNATPQELIGVASRYASPTDLLHYGQASLDRQEATKARLLQSHELAQYRIDNLQRQRDADAARVRSDEGKKAIDEWYKGEILKLKAYQQSLGVKPPSGYRTTTEGNLEAIPGGPADLKQQGQFNQDTSSLNESLNSMDRLAQEANAIKEHPGLGGITGVRGIVPNIPGTAPANAQARLDTLKSQVAFGVLQNMRNNSKTGGALGQVSNVEEKMLQDNLAGLGRAQSKEEYQKALQRIIDYTEGAKDRLRKAYNMKHGGSSPQSSPTPQGVDPRVWAVMTPQEKALWQSPQ